MTRTRAVDPFAHAVYASQPREDLSARVRHWRRRGLPVLGAVAIVVAVAVVTDLPTRASLADQRSAALSLIEEVNTDLKPCTYSLKEASTIYREVRGGHLSAVHRAQAPTLLGQDASACSFTSDNVNDLADIEEPGTGAGRWLSEVVSLAQTWTTSDALGAINDLTTLEADPHNTAAARDLLARERYLAVDRREALQAMKGVSRFLDGDLPSLEIPAVRLPR